jgi:L,D-peptidoglycan transpeptidase YkuD (ErfK/YbiS/YcfS/YnhG family)
MTLFRRAICLGILSASLFGCKGPPIPQELAQAEAQEQELWRIGGPLYAAQEFDGYALRLKKAKEDLARERSAFVLLRDYDGVRAELQELLRNGERLRVTIQERKQARAVAVGDQIGAGRSWIANLRRLASMINEGYLARKNLTKADVTLIEAEVLYRKGEFGPAQERLNDLQAYLRDAQQVLAPIVARYTGLAQIAEWRRMAEETVSESRQRGGVAIVVSKIDRRLMVYRDGDLVKTYTVAIGRLGSSLKRYAGDRATPEGKYSIIKKRSTSAYYKALLIDYPNAEDRRKFSAAKERGSIPHLVGIGGSVEIHGGGKDGMTYGCIALDDAQMAELFDMVEVGTRVTIVGSTEYRNSLSSASNGL